MNRFNSICKYKYHVLCTSNNHVSVLKPSITCSLHSFPFSSSADDNSPHSAEAKKNSPSSSVPVPLSPLTLAAKSAGFSRRLLRLSDDLTGNRRAYMENGRWKPAKLNAVDLSRFKRLARFNALDTTPFDVTRLRRVTPVAFKGHKRVKTAAERKLKIVEAMKDMEDRVEEHWKNERARRVRSTLFQIITGKKPTGVIAAEEAAAKERKAKVKLQEQARQLANAKK